MNNPPDGRPLKLLAFGFDASEASQIRRMRSYIECGYDVTGFMMRRANMNTDFVPFWKNIHLHDTENQSPARRILAITASIAKLARHQKELDGTDVIVARNLDMLAIAAAAQRRIRPAPALIYECLDIHNFMTDKGPKGRLFRAVERRLLQRCDALIVSSPAFVREYFEPVQNWRGPVALVENKIWIGADGPARPLPGSVEDPVPPGRPLVLGWVGTLRCAPSLKLLAETADMLGERVQIDLHGVVHRHALPEFDDTIAKRPNMAWHGAYDYPADLERIYRACDLVWSQDLWQWGTNSTWLLPNRIYEASYFGCPSIAVGGTETGRRVADGLGWTLPKPQSRDLADLLQRLSFDQIADRKARLLRRPASDFRQSASDIARAVEAWRQPIG